MIKGLYTIVDNDFLGGFSHAELAEMFLKGGAGIVQLRWKRGQFVARDSSLVRNRGHVLVTCPRISEVDNLQEKIRNVAREILRLKQKFDFAFIINDYVGVARDVGADGVHLGETDMPVAEARKVLGGKMLIGFSAHDVAKAKKAENDGADYVGFGAIFPTPIKGPDHPIQGLEKLREVVAAVKVPVVAIGGINRTNIKSVIEAGASSVAMIRGLVGAKDIVKEVNWYIDVIKRRLS